MSIKDIEDLHVWGESRVLMTKIYDLTDAFPVTEKFNIVKHMRACARNIPANIAEGFGRFHYQESMQFYRIARGSLAELKSDIYCSFDRHYIAKKDLVLVIDQINKVGRLLNGFIKSTIKVKNHTSN